MQNIDTFLAIAIRRALGTTDTHFSDEQLASIQSLTFPEDKGWLDPWKNKLEPTEMPELIRRMSNLKSLRIRWNGINAIPDWIGTLHHLETLDLCRNCIPCLPKALLKLSKLTELRIASNGISELPDWLMEMKNLKIFDLSENLFG